MKKEKFINTTCKILNYTYLFFLIYFYTRKGAEIYIIKNFSATYQASIF